MWSRQRKYNEIIMYIRTLPASYKGDFCWGDEANFFLWQNPTRIWLFDKFKSFLTSEASFECIWTSQIVKFKLDFAKYTNSSSPSINPPEGVAG